MNPFVKLCGMTVLATVLIVGCGGTAGRDFDTAHVHDVKGGLPKSQISEWFGAPNQTVTMSANAKGCVERWIYSYGHSKNGSTQSRALIVDFDDKATVCDTAYSEKTQ